MLWRLVLQGFLFNGNLERKTLIRNSISMKIQWMVGGFEYKHKSLITGINLKIYPEIKSIEHSMSNTSLKL